MARDQYAHVRAALVFSTALVTLLSSTVALADPKPEGHVGVATPFVTVGDETTTIADQFTLLVPIGVGLKPTDSLVIDFETVVATPIKPGGTNGLVVDPGVVVNTGPVAVGLRVAFQINQRGNVGLIPLVNRGIVDFGGAAWFVEAAFPTFFDSNGVTFNAVLHTGVGF